jgi:hypothetical protein
MPNTRVALLFGGNLRNSRSSREELAPFPAPRSRARTCAHTCPSPRRPSINDRDRVAVATAAKNRINIPTCPKHASRIILLVHSTFKVPTCHYAWGVASIFRARRGITRGDGRRWPARVYERAWHYGRGNLRRVLLRTRTHARTRRRECSRVLASASECACMPPLPPAHIRIVMATFPVVCRARRDLAVRRSSRTGVPFSPPPPLGCASYERMHVCARVRARECTANAPISTSSPLYAQSTKSHRKKPLVSFSPPPPPPPPPPFLRREADTLDPKRRDFSRMEFPRDESS